MLLMKKNKHGFSLTELAIVLGVIGLVLSAIWTVMPWGNETARQRQLSSEIYETVRNVRALYAGTFGISGTTATLVPQLYTQNALTGENSIRTNGGCTNAIIVAGLPYTYCLDNPWGYTSATAAVGSFGICAWTPGTTTACSTTVASGVQFFAVEVLNLTMASCINAVVNNTGPSSPPGLVDIVINGVSVQSSLGTKMAAAANTQCGAALAPGAILRIDYVYRLVPPQS